MLYTLDTYPHEEENDNAGPAEDGISHVRVLDVFENADPHLNKSRAGRLDSQQIFYLGGYDD